MKTQDSRKEQAYIAEKYAAQKIKKAYAPCAVVKLCPQKKDYSYYANINGIEKARKKLFTTKENKRFEKKFKKFRWYLDQINLKTISSAGFPDFIVISKKDFFFVEVKSYQYHQKKKFYWERMHIDDNQKLLFPSLAEQYKLLIGIVKLTRELKPLEIITKNYEDCHEFINKKKRKLTKKLTKKEKQAICDDVAQTKLTNF